jgi:3-methyladenine DNA glycosylase AlkD
MPGTDAPDVDAPSTDVNAAARLAAEIVRRVAALSNQNTESVRAVRREFSKQIAKSNPAAIFDLAISLLDHSQFLLRFVAYELLAYHKPSLKSLDAQKLQRLGEGMDNWAAVDTFACYLAGPAWRESQVEDKLIHEWAQSADRWWRRVALASTIALNNKTRGGRGDAARTLKVCEMLMADRDDMVVKAMSWALRELAKRNPEPVRKFLAQWQKFLAPRVIREVNNKLRTGLKTPPSAKQPGV